MKLPIAAAIILAWVGVAEAGTVGSGLAPDPNGPLPGCDLPSSGADAKGASRNAQSQAQAQPQAQGASCDLPDARERGDRFINSTIRGISDDASSTKLDPNQDLDQLVPPGGGQ